MRKFMRKFGVPAAFAFFCSFLSAPASAAYKAEYKLDIVPSITTGWGMGAQYFSDLVKERSEGKINIKVYPNAQLTTGKQGQDGVDCAIEAVGIPATWNMCQDIVKPGGHIAVVGTH